MSETQLYSPLLSPRHGGEFKHIHPSAHPPVRPGSAWSQILRLAVPNVVSSLAMYSTVVITTLCISREDKPSHLAAFGLGSLIGNVLGLSIGVGLTSVLETLVSQAYGAGNIDLASVYLNRARFVVTLAIIPCSVCLNYTDAFLLWLEQDPSVAALAADYTRATIFGLLPFFYFNCSSSFLRSCQHPQPPLIANIVGSVIHLFVTWYFVNVLKSQLWGAGIAMSINSAVKFVILEIYLASKPSLHGHRFTKEMFQKIGHFMGLGVPSFLLVAVEWSAFELQSVFAGWVSTQGLAAHVAGVNVIAIVFMIPNGVSQSLSTLIGASLGEGLPKLAEDFTRKGALLMFFVACSYGLAIFFSVNGIAHIYSTDPITLSILEPVLTITSVFVIADAMNTTQAGIIRGLGLQSRAARYQTIAMFGVMLPVGYFAYPYLGVPGVWTGSIAGMVTSAILFFTIIQNADYQECSRRAMQESRLHVIESLVTDI